MLDSERAMPPGKESQTYLSGETTKCVIENYLRSLFNGSKYVFQTLPKVLTLWFELIDKSDLPQDSRRGNTEFHAKVTAQRKRIIEETNGQIKKYTDRLQPVLLYTILPQIVARICHSNKAVQEILGNIVVKVKLHSEVCEAVLAFLVCALEGIALDWLGKFAPHAGTSRLRPA